MSKRSDALLADMLRHRWSVTAAPAAGSTVVCSVGAPHDASTRHNLESLSISVRNMAAATHTVTAAVRDSSIAGTVRWSYDFLVAVGASKELVVDSMGLQGLQGQSLHVTTDTVLASVKATVNIAGWTDQSSG